MSFVRLQKKNIRKNFTISFTIVFLIIILSATGCANKKYGEKDIEKFVKNVFGKAWTMSEAHNDSYIFCNESGIDFTVTIEENHPFAMDGANGPAVGYYVCDDYYASVYRSKAEEIDSLCDEYDFSFSKNNYSNKFILLINNDNDAEHAAEVLSKIDSILSFECNYKKSALKLKSNEAPSVKIGYKSRQNSKKDYLCKIKLSVNESDRLSKEYCLRKINLNIKP